LKKNRATKKPAIPKNTVDQQRPVSAAIFEWRKVDGADDDEPLSNTSKLLLAVAAYRAARSIAETAIKARDTSERYLLDLASGKLAEANT
jgi:hypothetical protein